MRQRDIPTIWGAAILTGLLLTVLEMAGCIQWPG